MGTFLIDESGCGILTYAVDDPEGVSYEEAGYGEVYGLPLEPRMYLRSPDYQQGGSINVKLHVDKTTSTATHLDVVAYFAAGETYQKGDNLYFTVYDGGAEGKEPYAVAIQPRTYAPVRTFTAANGETARISAVGITVDNASPAQELTVQELTLHYADGTSYVVSSDSQNLIKQILKEMNLDDKRFQPSGILSRISNAKNALQDAAAFARQAGDFYEQKVADIYSRYEQKLQLNNALDFDDLLMLSIKLDMDVLLQEALPQDLVKFGLIPELVGRLPVTVSLDLLDRDALIRILTEPKSAIVKQYQKLLELDGVKLEFDKDALLEIADTTLKRKTGARGLRAIMENIMMDTMFTVPSDETIKECRITKEAVLGTEPPRYTRDGEERKSFLTSESA